MKTNPDQVRLMEAVARHFCGEPNHRFSSKDELRFGAHGSLSVDLKKGVYYDHENNQDGPLDLIKLRTGITDIAGCYQWAEREGYWRKPNGKDHQQNRSREVAHYDYTDVAGALLFQVVRFEPKTFKQRRPNGHGDWIWNVDGVSPVPYRLPELVEAIGNAYIVCVPEGEKDVDRLRSLGVPATCNAGGANKWRDELTTHFADAEVVVIADNDAPGRKHANDVAARLQGVAKRVRLLELGRVWPQCPPKGDISDWIEQTGGTAEQLYAIIEQLPEWSASDNNEPPLFDPWERYIVPDFPLHVLPPVVQRYVTSQSVVIGCDPSALAMAALTALSGAIHHRTAVKMMRNGGWWEHPRLWTLLVGDPSCKKTPIINDVTVPLERHQNDLRRSYEAALRDYEAAKKDKDDTVEKPDPPPRYVVWDTTTEKLGEILSRSDHGLLVKRDEFSGWIGGMEKYSGASRGAGADRGFWLQAYDGGPHSIDRIGRGETYIGNLSVSLLGGIQPARLSELRGLTSDGLLQRFAPVMMRSSNLPRDCQSGDDQENYQSLVYKLIRAKPQRLFLNDRALSLMNDLRARLHELEQAAAGLADGLLAFIGKLAGMAGRVAVILHMAANPESTPHEIDAMTVAYVHSIILDFILPHAVEFYRSTEELTGGERLRKIASWILTSQQKLITARDLIRNVSSLRGASVWELHKFVSPLVAAGWLEADDPDEPISRAWTVNDAVARQFEQHRKTEHERKILAAKLMGSPRKPTGN